MSIQVVLFTLALLLLGAPASAQANFKGLPEATSDDTKQWAVVFDFDTDSCYPAPAVSREGEINGGLKDSGSVTGECRQLDQFKNANTYYRKATLTKDSVEYTVRMYALYFEKDQAIGFTNIGHRH